MSRHRLVGWFIIGLAILLDKWAGHGFSQDKQLPGILYGDWMIGKKQLIVSERAAEFGTIFQAPIHHAVPKRLDEIVAMYGELEPRFRAVDDPVEPAITPQFIVPKKYYSEVYEAIKSTNLDTRPYFERAEAGTIKIYTSYGYMVRVCWYPMQVESSPLVLSIHGIRYVGKRPDNDVDLGIQFTELIKRARSESLGNERRK